MSHLTQVLSPRYSLLSKKEVKYIYILMETSSTHSGIGHYLQVNLAETIFLLLDPPQSQVELNIQGHHPLVALPYPSTTYASTVIPARLPPKFRICALSTGSCIAVGAHDTSDSRSVEIIGTTVVLKSRSRFSEPRIGVRTVAGGDKAIIEDLSAFLGGPFVVCCQKYPC
jgi:hypothetical protein